MNSRRVTKEVTSITRPPFHTFSQAATKANMSPKAKSPNRIIVQIVRFTAHAPFVRRRYSAKAKNMPAWVQRRKGRRVIGLKQQGLLLHRRSSCKLPDKQ